MAEVTGLRNNALPYPIYGVPFGVTFPILDADGDLVTGASSLDSEVSLNADTFADCTNEATEIATSSGMYYLLLTAAEMTADVVTVIVKTGTAGAKTTPLTFNPRKLVAIRSGTAAGGASGSITLDASASAIDDYYNGCVVVGTLDSAVEARVITDYNGTTKVASVTPNWNTTPDSDDTFIVYLPEGRQITQALTHNATAIASESGQSTLQSTANAIETDTQDIQGRLPASLVSGRIDCSVGAMAANTLTASALNADAVAEIFGTALTESYATDGAAGTAAQILYLIQAVLTELTISSVTGTVKKLDGSTTAATLTYNDATTPTSVTRSG